METIDFNTVIAENISVVEGLIGTVNDIKNGLMPKTGFIQRKQITSSDDYDNFIDSGIYDISSASGALHKPNNVAYGVMKVCYYINSGRVTQTVIQVPENVLYIRCRTGGNVWSEWKSY